jgi:hypothetical protein
MGNYQVKEYDDFVPREKLLEIIRELNGRLYTVAVWLEDAMEGLEVYADMRPTEDGVDEPNHALAVLSSLSQQIKQAPFSLEAIQRNR